MADDKTSQCEKSFPYKHDIFDDDVEDDSIVCREWQKIQAVLKEGGYREGLTSGKESTLQEGFNNGFTDAAQTLYRIARQRGELCAKLTLQSELCEKDLQDINRRLEVIRKEEQNLINASKNKTIEELKLLKNQS